MNTDWQPSMSWQVAKQRAELLKKVRTFFERKGVIEVDTPLLCSNTVTDVHLESIQAKFHWSESGTVNQHLQTSPEYAMKRLLAAGYQSIYQICKAFRNESQGRYHNPEFTMLEWYQLDYSMHELIEEIGELLTLVLDISSYEVLSYQRAFKTNTQIDPLTTCHSELLAFIEQKGKLEPWLKESTSVDTLLQFIFCEFVEPNIGQDKPCFIHSFPASQASLATLNEDDARVANRFECYYKSIELANGFNELDDVEMQLKRFQQDNAIRKEEGLADKVIDKNFIAALTHGLPACSGVALGIERLLMLALGKDSIDQVMAFVNNKA